MTDFFGFSKPYSIISSVVRRDRRLDFKQFFISRGISVACKHLLLSEDSLWLFVEISVAG